MDQFRTEGITAITIYIIISVCMVLAILIVGVYNEKAKEFSRRVRSKWKQSLLLTVAYFVFATIGSGFSGLTLLWSFGLFCQLLVGLTISSNIDQYQPFPITTNMIKHQKVLRSCVCMLGIAVIAGLLIMVTSSLSMMIGGLFGESGDQSTVAELMPKNGLRAFFSILAGAGMIEGVTYRLIVLSLALKYIKQKWLAILVSTGIFILYHFLPINVMYHVYWQIPIAQFLNVFFGASIIGYLYTKRGFETSVLAHTFADWLPLLAYIYFM